MLTGKVALVTGSGRGIGKAIALMLAERGADIVINDLNMDNAVNTVEEIKELGRKAIAVKADVSNEAEVEEMVKECINQFSRIDILVNNAGLISTKLLPETTVREWDRIMDINLKGVFICTKAVYPYMVNQKSGKIINIASVAGKRGGGLFGKSAYSASKGGVIAFTKAVAREAGEFGINVNAVTPGFTETEMVKDISQDQRVTLVNSIPLKRPGSPADIAKAVCFLASSDSDYISGEIMDVDGGIMMD
jgi:NAD(P)-dependent dehydrogenase (short-subunit alcohol dehydrogenase family)